MWFLKPEFFDVAFGFTPTANVQAASNCSTLTVLSLKFIVHPTDEDSAGSAIWPL